MKKIKELINNVKLKTKFIGFALSLSVLSSVAILIASMIEGQKTLENEIISGITNIAELKTSHINEFYDRAIANLEVTASSSNIENYLLDSSNTSQYSKSDILETFMNAKNYHNYFRISLLDQKHTALISTDSYFKGKMLPAHLIQTTRMADGSISNSKVYKYGDLFMISFFKAITNEYHEIVGYIAIDVDMKSVYEMIQNSAGLGETGETLLGIQTETGALFINPLRHDPNAALQRTAKFGDDEARPILEATQAKSGHGILRDYRGKEVIAVWRYVPSFNWGLVTKIDVDEALKPVYNLANVLIAIALIATLIGIFASVRFAIMLTVPIVKLKDAMNTIGKGNVLKKKLKKYSNDEVGEMIDQANNLVEFQKNIIEFTEEIGQGNFEFESTHDISQGDLGKELLKMKDSLQKAHTDEQKRNWVTEGLAKFANILRNNNDDLELLADDIVTNLVKYLNANQGGLFILNDDGKEPKMELISAYAYDRKKFMEKSFQLGEGLVGQCWQEKEQIFLTEIPQSYINITSGLGTTNPSCIIIVPLMINEEIYGVFEIASFKVLDEYEIEFIEKLASSIASTLSSVKASLKTTALLEESQQMSEELQAQEEELRQNAEEMQATQEELERNNKEIIAKSIEMKSLFEGVNSTMATIEFTPEGNIIDANDNFLNTVKYDLESIKGKHHKMFVPDEIANSEEYTKFWSDLADGNPNAGIFKRKDSSGRTVWLSAIYNPVKNENEEVFKIVKFATDVTKEQQMKEELQAQEESLLQNAEEMQAANEEIENAKLELEKKEGALRAIFDNMDDTIFAINKDYEITVVNAKLRNKYKNAGIDLSPGKNILEILPEDKRGFWKDRYDKAMSGESFETVDEVSPGVKAVVNHYPTYNDSKEITGVAVVSRVLEQEKNG